MPINLPEHQTINGKVLKHIAGNGPVYIRSINGLEVLNNIDMYYIKV